MSRAQRVLLSCVALLLAPIPAAAQITVGHLVRMMETTAGRGSIEITVRNEGEDAVDVTIDVRDWAVDSAGNHSFAPAGTLEESCGARLRTDAKSLRIDGRGTRTVHVLYEAPAAAPAERCRNIVFFRVTGAADEIGGDQLIISTGVKVYVGPRETP